MNKDNILKLINECRPAKIVAATKYVSKETIISLLELGIKDIGENKVDSFLSKYDKSLDCSWHFIGHLQRNKAKLVANKIDYLHSLDSIELAKILDKLQTKPLNVFVEVKLVDSDTKSGVSKDELNNFLSSLKEYKNINVIGLMTMTDPSSGDDEKNEVFKSLYELAKQYNLHSLSMGMSDDYQLAINNNATHVRLGRILYEYSDILDEYKYYFK